MIVKLRVALPRSTVTDTGVVAAQPFFGAAAQCSLASAWSTLLAVTDVPAIDTIRSPGLSRPAAPLFLTTAPTVVVGTSLTVVCEGARLPIA